MLIVKNSEVKALENNLFEVRQELKQAKKDLKEANLEIGNLKAEIVLLRSENKTLNNKLEKEVKKNDNA